MTSLTTQREAYEQQTERLRVRLKQVLRFLGIASLAALALRSFFYEPFSLPSQSMQPRLQPGDTIFVAKWPYGLSRHTLPISPQFLSGRLFARLPSRGDVIVFKTPRDGQTDFVKRVIALPGDTIAMRDGRPVLNGKPVPRVQISKNNNYKSISETLPGNRNVIIYEAVAPKNRLSSRDNFGPIIVPSGMLFLLGDNRDASADSRYTAAEGGIGLVPLDLVIGRADFIIYAQRAVRIGNRP